VIRGNLLIIPIEGSLLYVEPLYLQATNLKIPQVKRVVVVYGQQVVMEPTLDGAIARIFAGAAPTPAEAQAQPPAPPQATLAQQALDLYSRAVQAQKNGDWATYGQLLNQLNDVLKQLASQP
jgi:uncharacterized membrane protein (UPF0182 family)